jgi:hypothetical protein
MLERILELLKHSEPNTDAIQIAKGRYKYPKSWGDFINNLKLGAYKNITK